LKYNPQSNLLAVGSHDNNIYIYKIEEENYSLKGTLKGHNSFITGVDWS
jgi:WD40 repeat protein